MLRSDATSSSSSCSSFFTCRNQLYTLTHINIIPYIFVQFWPITTCTQFLPSDAYAHCTAQTMPDYAMAKCPTIRQSHASIVSKRLDISSIFFSPSGRPTILVFPHQTGWQYSDADPLTEAWNARWYENSTIFDQYWALFPNWCKINKALTKFLLGKY